MFSPPPTAWNVKKIGRHSAYDIERKSKVERDLGACACFHKKTEGTVHQNVKKEQTPKTYHTKTTNCVSKKKKKKEREREEGKKDVM